MAILVNGVKVAGVGVPGTNGKDATINGVNALTVEGLDPIVAQMVGSVLQISFSGDIGGAKVETGSYVGTGTNGKSNPTEIVCTFDAKCVIVTPANIDNVAYMAINVVLPQNGGGFATGGAGNSKDQIYSSVSNGTVSWYITSESALYQCNYSGTTYCWVAIG